MADRTNRDFFLGNAGSDKPDTINRDFFLGAKTDPTAEDAIVKPPKPDLGLSDTFTSGVKRGVFDVADTGAEGIGYLDTGVSRLFKTGGEERAKAASKRFETERSEYEKKFGDSLLAGVGRFTGQSLATAPLVSGRALQGIRSLAGNLPVTIAGQATNPHWVKQYGSSILENAYAGGTYGLATSSTEKGNPLINMLEGAGEGAVGGPIMKAGAGLGAGILPTIFRARGRMQINSIANEFGIPATAATKVLDKLEAAGFTDMDEVHAALKKMGPEATILDLSDMLSQAGRGIASTGDRPLSILFGRMGERGSKADNDALKAVINRFGPKPNLEEEKAAVLKTARDLTRADYNEAYTSGDKLDTSGIIKSINDRLRVAVGKEENELNKFKSSLYQKDGILKDNIESLHAVRQALDSRLSELPSEGTSAQTQTFRSVEKLRSDVDKLLKTNPKMAAADAKFAEHMKIKNGFDQGYEAITNYTRDEFNKVWSSANPQTQEAIKRGLSAYVHDAIDLGTQGDLSKLQRLFGKTRLNRDKLTTVFGNDGVNLLEDLATKIVFRNTERRVTQGADTAFNQQIQREFGERSDGGSHLPWLGPLADVMGGGGLGTAVEVSRRGLASTKANIAGSEREKIKASVADILSRNEDLGRDEAVSVLKRVKDVRDKLLPTNSEPGFFRRSMLELQRSVLEPRLNLPTILPGSYAIDQINKKIQGK